MNPRTPTSQLDENRRRAVRRTAWIAAAVAIAVFVGFIAKAVLP
ncbi:hypothetical protein [Arenimonas composti]|uniref:Uncharacterized protein n=1 Tax=Arenimonas composti TR7-09 = DSM 18010 TaxID=1121013 RepID=A0A091BDP0_9GAMM|nr:hypothetical protein [Arenimonas composti]KFN49856.1 hypothetical protein P873_09030 [Arenimonas composti TR7-09 = DSM 18010]